DFPFPSRTSRAAFRSGFASHGQNLAEERACHRRSGALPTVCGPQPDYVITLKAFLEESLKEWRMSSRKNAKVAFVSAVVLILLCGVAAIVAISRYSNSAQWVNRTYEVTVAAGRVESTLSEAARARLSYITSGDPSFLQQYESAKKEVSEDLLHVRELTLDNPLQQDKFNRLGKLANQRIALLQTSLDARATGQPDSDLQTKVSLENTDLAS